MSVNMTEDRTKKIRAIAALVDGVTLSKDEAAALRNIARSQLQNIFPELITKSLLEKKLIKQVLSGGYIATEKGQAYDMIN